MDQPPATNGLSSSDARWTPAGAGAGRRCSQRPRVAVIGDVGEETVYPCTDAFRTGVAAIEGHRLRESTAIFRPRCRHLLRLLARASSRPPARSANGPVTRSARLLPGFAVFSDRRSDFPSGPLHTSEVRCRGVRFSTDTGTASPLAAWMAVRSERTSRLRLKAPGVLPGRHHRPKSRQRVGRVVKAEPSVLRNSSTLEVAPPFNYER